MAYDYYRNSVPGWGTSQFQFGAPPMPAFQPQPSWTGMDFYNAHAYNPDPSLYHSIMGRMGSYSGIGSDHQAARQWHNMIYGGLTPLTQVLPADIGAAAAYEVYRTWKYNSSLYAPLSADRMMQREGLIGMAIAEATRLWQYTGRAMDAYGQRAACETAAATAANLADRLLSYVGSGGSSVYTASPNPSPYLSGMSLPAVGTSYGAYPGSYAAQQTPYLTNPVSYGGYSPGARVIPTTAGSTVVVTKPRHRSHSRHHSHSRSHSDDGHHHHRHRSRSVDIIQTGGPQAGYVPYTGAGYGGYGYGGYRGYRGNYPSGCVIC